MSVYTDRLQIESLYRVHHVVGLMKINTKNMQILKHFKKCNMLQALVHSWNLWNLEKGRQIAIDYTVRPLV